VIDALLNILKLSAFLWLGGVVFAAVGMAVINALKDA
jgi:hypothetical protein